MTRREAVKELKKQIKEKAQEQKERRLQLAKPHHEIGVQTAGSLMSAKWRERITITALLNLYNELRGREYRHGIQEGLEYLYHYDRNKLEESIVSRIVEEKPILTEAS